jgi:hypothetical protein
MMSPSKNLIHGNFILKFWYANLKFKMGEFKLKDIIKFLWASNDPLTLVQSWMAWPNYFHYVRLPMQFHTTSLIWPKNILPNMKQRNMFIEIGQMTNTTQLPFQFELEILYIYILLRLLARYFMPKDLKFEPCKLGWHIFP